MYLHDCNLTVWELNDMTNDTMDISIDDIINAVKAYNPNADFPLILKAYNLANEAHATQKRVSGEKYITHPLHVAMILTELHIDDVTIAAALLHDVVEDTIYTIDQMKEMFGDEVAMLIDGVTKLGRMKYKSKEDQQLETYRKMFLAMAKDIRVIMIKLADRLHNMRTLKYMREEKQKRIARETLEVYAPLANRLGISNIKWELEDLCLRYLEPETYYDLVDKVNQKREERQGFINAAIESIQKELDKVHLKGEIKGRAKHFYSIYRKMKKGNKELSDIFDLLAVRVLVQTIPDCYTVLGIIHAMWKPLPGRFKDYIAVPKTNGYQSLHTTVITDNGIPLEIQIRTFAMHAVSEYGIAAHWKYKEAGNKSIGANSEYDKKLSWLRQMITLQDEFSDPREYFEALKIDIFSDEVFVYTPRGDVINLPKGSNPIDFAYHIHTDIGNHCVGAKVNGKIVPLEYKLQNGDVVSVVTNKQNNGPSPDWLNIVASSQTRTKIRQWFKKQKREENVARGMELLELEAKHLGYEYKDLIKNDRLVQVAKKLNIQNLDDMFATIGYGGLTVNSIMSKLIAFYKKDLQEITPPDITQMLEKIKPRDPNKKKASHGILVEGEAGFLVHLAKCCNPIPGDQIIGYITRGRGVSVHRADCPNVLREGNDMMRVIDVNWDVGTDKQFYPVTIEIGCYDRQGILTEILARISDAKINIENVLSRSIESNKTAIISITFSIKNTARAEQLMNTLRHIKGVYSVRRTLSSGKTRSDLQ